MTTVHPLHHTPPLIPTYTLISFFFRAEPSAIRTNNRQMDTEEMPELTNNRGPQMDTEEMPGHTYDSDDYDDCENAHPNIKPLSLDTKPYLKNVEKPSILHPSTIWYDDHEWTKHKDSADGLSASYRCKYRRGKSNCKKRMTRKFDSDTGSYATTQGVDKHTCKTHVFGEGVIDLVAEQKVYIQDNINEFTSRGKPLMTLAREVHEEYQKAHQNAATVSLTVPQLYEQLRLARRSEQGMDWETRVFQHPLVSTSPTDLRNFLQFSSTVYIPGPDGICREKKRILGWAHPDLLFQLRHGAVHCFIDGTFDCCPHGFVQCLIFMVYLPAVQMYVPVFYVLVDTKLEAVYTQVFTLMLMACGGEKGLRVSTVTADFEKGLLNSIKAVLKKNVIGCGFHWKQAIRKNMITKYHFDKDLVTFLIGPGGVLEILTILPPEEALSSGVPYAKAKTAVYLAANPRPHALVEKFYAYLEKTWFRYYSVADFNVYDLSLKSLAGTLTEEDIINRTNNPLERFNRRFNNHFPNRDPQMDVFVTVLKEISQEYVDDLQRIQRQAMTCPKRVPPHFPAMPEDFDAVMATIEEANVAAAVAPAVAPAAVPAVAPALAVVPAVAPAPAVPPAAAPAVELAVAPAPAVPPAVVPAVAPAPAVPPTAEPAVAPAVAPAPAVPPAVAPPDAPAALSAPAVSSAVASAVPTPPRASSSPPLALAAIAVDAAPPVADPAPRGGNLRANKAKKCPAVVPPKNMNTWVQCEECRKWHLLPAHVDASTLPDVFYCEENTWDDANNYCVAEENG